MKRILSVTLPGLVLGTALAPLTAQTIESIVLSKSVQYRQTDATTVVPWSWSENPEDGGPYGFDAGVEGEDLSGLPAPTITGPITATEGTPGLPNAEFINGGVLVYDPFEEAWNFGVDGDNFGTSSKANLDAAFGNGTYTLTVQGTALALPLTPEDYPNTIVFTLSGGEWNNGRYEVPFDAALTITTNAFTGYGTHVEDAVFMSLWGRDDDYDTPEILNLASTNPGENTLSLTVPANTLTAGNRYELEAGFFAGTFFETDHANFPGTMIVAGFEVSTNVEIVATPLPDPQPVTAGIEPAIAVRFSTQTGGRYMIEESTDLENWYIVRSDLYGDGGERVEFFERFAPSQHYRVTRTFP